MRNNGLSRTSPSSAGTLADPRGGSARALTAAPERPLSALQRGEISTALIEFGQPETDADFERMQVAQRRIEAAVEGDLHPWKAIQ